MIKQELYKILNKEQQEYIDFLIDAAYSNGYTDALIKLNFDINEEYSNN